MTGVQTCALPIYPHELFICHVPSLARTVGPAQSDLECDTQLMRTWSEFSEQAQTMSVAAKRLLDTHEVAFLATVSASGRPRLHPFVPRIVDGRLVAFVMDDSPKLHDLGDRGQYAIHTAVADEDEEFYLSGVARLRDDDATLGVAADVAMGFATGPVDEHHVLYEFLLDRALWTRWLDFRTPNHRPERSTWRV